MNHNRIVTPETDPDRFTEEETALFRKGICAEVVEFGNFGPPVRCGKPSHPGASFGNCEEHDAEMLESHWPDGTPRDDDYGSAGWQRRIEYKLEVHRKHCTDETCECRS